MQSTIEKEMFRLEYIRYKRFVVEINDKESGQVFFTKRFCQRYTATTVKRHYNRIAGYMARLFDTKTGEVC